MTLQLGFNGFRLISPVSVEDCDIVLSTADYYLGEAERVRDNCPKGQPIWPIVFALLSVNAPFGATCKAYEALRDEDTNLLDFWSVLQVVRSSHAPDGVVSYPWTKSKWIQTFVDSFRHDGVDFRPFVTDTDYRSYLQVNVKGLGLAKASFATMLVNGSADVACIDTHMYRLFEGKPAQTAVRAKTYLRLEESVRTMAYRHGLPTSVAQHCLWDAMRGIRTRLLP